MSDLERYADFVDHPRFGRAPRFTKLTPRGHVFIGWRRSGMVPNTAVRADVAKQAPATFHVTHYFDFERQCCDCNRDFIFFADEQKYWYEELRFGLDSDCIRCVPCRKQLQGIARSRRKYEELFHKSNRTPDESLAMAECCLELIEKRVFSTQQTQRIRMLLNRIPHENVIIDRAQLIRQRLYEIEQSTDSDV